MRTRALEYGQTPWDDMPREELLREMQRAYAAANAARSALALAAGPEPSAFWRPGGTGHRALAMCETVIARVETKHGTESVYRSFFRYAVDLLFSPELGFGWRVCSNGHMFGLGPRRLSKCSVCRAPLRDIEWSDISPDAAVGDCSEGAPT